MPNRKTATEKLFDLLKNRGIFFPTTNKEVEEFEQRYGKTDLELPEELKRPKGMSKKASEVEPELSEPLYQMAAFSNSGPMKTDIPKTGGKSSKKRKKKN